MLCFGQSFYALLKENRSLRDRPILFTARSTKTVQRDPKMHAIYRRIAITNDSREVAKDCELAIASWTFNVDGLSANTPLVVKDTNNQRATNINRQDTKEFDLFITRLMWGTDLPELIAVGAPNYPQIKAPTVKDILYDGPTRHAEIVCRLTGSNFNRRQFKAVLLLAGNDIEIESVIPINEVNPVSGA